MPEHDVENRAAVFGWPSCSKPLESITFVILDQPHPTSSRSVRRAYNMGSAVRSKKMAVSEPSLGMTALYYSLPPCGGGLGRGVAARLVLVVTPLSNSPPQGGREQTERVATATMDSIFHTAEVDRHCERSEAIHRAAQRKNGLLRFARNDVELQTRLHDLARQAPEPLMNIPPKEGVGNAGCPLHPRPRVHLVVVERTRVTTSTPESPDVPARNGFTAYFVLSPVTGLFCHRHRRICLV